MKIARGLDAELDRLYASPLDGFTAARNALAKQTGADGAAIRALEKPSVAAWAVNQLYWHRRAEYDALVRAAEQARAAHKAVLAGRSGDLREAGREHEAQIELALKATLSVLSEQGQPATDATKQAIATTLRALPVDGPPGRLSRPLQPGGFEMLAGLTLSAGAAAKVAKRVPAPEKAQPPKATRNQPGPTPQQAKALARARDAAASAARAIREAEHTAKRTEFDLARAVRESEKAAKDLSTARAALERAQQDVEDAEITATKAAKTKSAAEERSKQADSMLEKARARARAAQSEIESLER